MIPAVLVGGTVNHRFDLSRFPARPTFVDLRSGDEFGRDVGAGAVGTDEPVEMIHVARPSQCACGEPLLAGERAGQLGTDPTPVCLWCLTDVQAGRPRPRRRRDTTEWPEQLALLSPGPSGAYASPATTVVAEWSGSPRGPRSPKRPRRQSGGEGPRTAVSLLVTIVIVGVVLLGIPALLGRYSSGASTPGVTHGSSGLPAAAPVSGMPLGGGDDATGSAVLWPPVPADAKNTPLGRPPVQRSASTDYAFLNRVSDDASRPVAWDPCRPIHLVVNAASAPPGADRLLTEAASQVSLATGLQFVIEGPTDERPSEDRPTVDQARYGNRWSPVLVSWTDPGVVPRLKGTVVGLAGPDEASSVGAQDRHYVSGIVDFDGPAFNDILTSGDGWANARSIAMHELGHLVGLDHVPAKSQIMYESDQGRTQFGKGDLEGLRQLGSGPCFTR